MPHPIARPIRRPRPRESLLALALAFVCTGLLTLRERAGAPPDSGEEGPAFRGPETGGLMDLELRPERFPHFDIRVAPEFLRALDAAVPRGQECLKVRYKYVPIERWSLDGRGLPGPAELRYRGFCRPHWDYPQKSFKLRAPKGTKIRGYQTLNLNTLNIDPYFFEVWATQLLHRTGGVASRSALARLTLNGRPDGLRQVMENLDRDLLAGQALPKGALYRERFFAAIGRRYFTATEIQDHWKKNSLGRASWEDLQGLNDAVYASVRAPSDAYRSFLNIPHYLNYSAVAAITGTMHLTDHNIPMYRPRDDKRFIPIGYDFASNALGEFADRSMAVQSPYAAQNWLSQLVWSDLELRRRIHRRTASILERFPDLAEWHARILEAAGTDLSRDLPAGLGLGRPGEYPDLAAYLARDSVGPRLRARLDFLRQAYLDPLVRISPGWRELPESQLAIEGAGAYGLRFEASGLCPEGAELRVRVHEGPWRTAVLCRGGSAVAAELSAERNDILRPTLYTQNELKRNGIGAVLVDVKNRSGIGLKGLTVRSLQTGRRVPLREDWPFRIQDEGNGRVSLGSPVLPYRERLDGEGYAWVVLPRQTEHAFDARRALLSVRGPIDGPDAFDSFGPLLCWRLGGRDGCYELGRRFSPHAAPGGTESARAAADSGRELDAAAFRSCANFDFSAGTWRVRSPAESGRNCRVRFQAGAELLFDSGASLLLRGPVEFPDSGAPVVFTAAGKDWGGVILDAPGSRYEIQNARFSRANEFYRDGKRYTGALTVVSPVECLVHDNVFFDNFGDDGLNIRGGGAQVTRNLFYGNRDAMDFDAMRVFVAENLVLDSRDDGIDFGKVRRALVQKNVILGSGDKAVSVGEGSQVELEASLLSGNNIGLAVKEGSAAFLIDSILRRNRIALSIYRTPQAEPSDRDGTLRGVGVQDGNDSLLQKDGQPRPPPPEELVFEPYVDELRLSLIEQLLGRCRVCREKASAARE